MQTPQRRRTKRQSDEDNDEHYEETFSSPSKKQHSGQKGTWSEEESQLLKELINATQNGDENAKVSWATINEDFQTAFPHADKSLNALRMHYKNQIKNSDIDLTEEEVSE